MFNKWGIAAGAAAVVLCLGVDSSMAQQGRGGFGTGMRGGVISLANAEAVQKELGLSDEAKEKVASIGKAYTAEATEQMQGLGGGGFQNLSEEERQKLMEKIGETTRKLHAKFLPQLKEALNADQFARVQQISWQANGSQAFADPDLAKELTLTDEQKEKIIKINRESQQKQRELMANAFGGGGGGQEIFAKIRELNQQRDKQAEEVLNKEQQEKFTKLKGKPFDLTQLPRIGPGGGGGKKRPESN